MRTLKSFERIAARASRRKATKRGFQPFEVAARYGRKLGLSIEAMEKSWQKMTFSGEYQEKPEIIQF